MNVTFPQVETIFKELPIGYYATRRVATELSREEATSFYSPMEDKIVVSYPLIAQRMQNLHDTADVEEAVRSMLYHEVSHAILTNCDQLDATPINNIFEDERIETVLDGYYMNTNFKQQLYDLYDGQIPTPTNAQSAFFNVVRFRSGPEEFVQQVQPLIDKYAHLTRTAQEDDWWGWYNYANQIRALYDKVSKAYKKDPSDFTPPTKPKGQKGKKSEGKPFDKIQVTEEGQEGDNDGEGQENTNENAERPENADPAKLDKQKKLVQRAIGATEKPSDRVPLEPQQVDKVNDFAKTAEMIINNFNKKNSGGSGINAYSGVFNPRSVTRPDYRFFDRAMATQGNNKFGTCHLNLFIDCSGSMYNNQGIVNAALMALTDIEKRNRNFTMDVVFIGEDYTLCSSVRERYFIADGSNDLPRDLRQKILALQKQNTCNYNIVLFDGDCMCMGGSNEEKKVKFNAFDYKQTTVITDPDNQRYAPDGFKSAKLVVTHNYTEELLRHITKALMVAFG